MTFRCDRCGVLRDDSEMWRSPITDMPVCEECYQEEEEEDGDA